MGLGKSCISQILQLELLYRSFIKKTCSLRFTIQKSVYLKLFSTQLENVHLQLCVAWSRVALLCLSSIIIKYQQNVSHISQCVFAPYPLLICTWFLKKVVKIKSTNWIFSLQKSILKLIFAGYTGSKNSVQNRLKIQFVELDLSKLIFQKSSTDQQVVYK